MSRLSDYEEVKAAQSLPAENSSPTSTAEELALVWEKKQRRRRGQELEERLVEWGREYGGGRYEALGAGNSPLASMIKWHGRPPQGLSYDVGDTAKADEVQHAVEALAAQQKGFVPSLVIRCEYLLPGQPNESKLQRLRRLGHSMIRVRYYQHLRLAQVHVAGWLRIPFSVVDETSSQSEVV